MNRIATIAAVLILATAALAPAASAQTTITLRSAASIAAGEPVTLGSIAQVGGEDASRLTGIVILESAEAAAMARAGRLEVDLIAIRSALDRAGVNWGRTSLNGGAVGVRLTGQPAAAESGSNPAHGHARQRATESMHESVDLSAPPTVRTHIAARLAHLFAVDPADLRLRFRPEDEPALVMPTTGRRVDIQPAASASSARLPLRVHIYAGDRIITASTITVEVLLRREVLTASAPIARGQAITPELVSAGMQWLEPNARIPAGAAQILAPQPPLARARINAGETITTDVVEAPLAAKRGDLVSVHCLSGSVTVKVRARAMADVRDGDAGPFRLEGSKRIFHARMDGPGRAVMVTDSGSGGVGGGGGGGGVAAAGEPLAMEMLR